MHAWDIFVNFSALAPLLECFIVSLHSVISFSNKFFGSQNIELWVLDCCRGGEGGNGVSSLCTDPTSLRISIVFHYDGAQ